MRKGHADNSRKPGGPRRHQHGKHPDGRREHHRRHDRGWRQGDSQVGQVRDGTVIAGRAIEISDALEAESARVGGYIIAAKARLADLSAGERAEISGGTILGRIKVGGIFISKSELEFGSISVGGKVELGKRCKVQAVYGSKIVAGKGVTAGEIVAEDVELHDGAVVERITYTRSLEMTGDAACKTLQKRSQASPRSRFEIDIDGKKGQEEQARDLCDDT